MFKQIQAVSAGYKSKFMSAVESEGLRTGELLRLTGPAIFLDRISGNGRKYIPESVHMQVAELQPRIKQKALFGVLDHPPTDDLNVLAYVKMTDVSHRIDALWFNEAEQTYYVTVTILDTPNGRILKAIHDAGSPLFVSLRSLLDPSRNRQNNGYIDAWMLALITIDFVSRPGFADAELKAVDVSNEAAMAVCESLNLFKHTSKQDNSQNSRIFDMKTKKSQLRGSNRKLTCLPAIESIIGIATEPTGDFRTSVAAFIADVLTNLPGRFTMNDFMTQYPDNIFDGKMIGIYEDTNELAITDAEGKTIAMVKLESPIDGVFVLPKDAEVEYFNTEVTDNSDTVQTATESAALWLGDDVVSKLGLAKYGNVKLSDFKPMPVTDLKIEELKDADGIKLGLDPHSGLYLHGDKRKLVSLGKKLAGKFNITNDNEFYVSDNETGETISVIANESMYAVIATEDYTPDQDFIQTMEQVAAFMRDNYGTGFDMNTFNTQIMEQLKDRFGVSARIDLTDDQENELKVTDANGENGASILLDVSGDQMLCGAISEYWMPGTESAIGDNVKLIDASGEEIASGELENYGTWGEVQSEVKSEDETGYGIMEAADLSDDTECYKIGGNWYYLEYGMTVENVTAEVATEAKAASIDMSALKSAKNFKSLSKEYTVKDENGDILIHKTGSYPYKIVQTDNGFTLKQQYEGAGRKATWGNVKANIKTVDEAVDTIIKRHNKSAKIPGMGWKEIALEAELGDTVSVIETKDGNAETIATGKLEAQGTWGKLRDTIKSEDADAYGWMMNEHVSDDETVWKVDGNWYFGNNGIVTVECGDLDMIANEADDVIKQTEGEIVEAIDIDENYMQQSDLSQAEVVQQAEIIDEEDETAQQNQEQVTDTMYEVVEGDNATTQSEVYEVVEDDKDDVDADEADAEDRNLNELAIEAQRVFNMPNSKFAGNYAIEHMPDAYKHIWSGLSDSAKAVLARQAKAANVATEAQALKFFANTNFIAIERACLTAKGKVEAAFENLQPIDTRKSFLGAPLKNRR